MSSSYFPMFGERSKGLGMQDLEAGEGLFPGISATENMIRLGFIRKVFGIVTIQLVLTSAVAGFLMANPSIQASLSSSLAWQICLLLASILGLIPLYMYKDKHPQNLIILGAWTTVFSISVGLACTFYAPVLVLQAVVITAGVVAALTAYTFWATRRGVEFTWMGPMLFAMLWAMILWGFLQIIFRPGPLAQMIYSLLGALLFCGYIIFDVHLLSTRMDVDDYVWASVALYLDIINLFLYILRILGQNSNNN